jgi:hypothetical protein
MHVILFVIGMTIDKDEIPEFCTFEVLRSLMEFFGIREIFEGYKKVK